MVPALLTQSSLETLAISNAKQKILTCHKGIETNLVQQTITITNKKYKTKGADWKEWENEITLSLSEGFQERPNLNSKSDIDNFVAKLTNIINKTAGQSLGIAKTRSYDKFWWNKQLTEAHQNYNYKRITITVNK